MTYRKILKLASIFELRASFNVGEQVLVGSKSGTVVGVNDSGCFPDGSIIVNIDGHQEYVDPENVVKKQAAKKGDLYRKRPVVVHAYQTDHDMYIDTLEVKPDIFEETYERVNDTN